MVEQRWLVVVRRNQARRIPVLRKAMPGAADFLLDRRDGERRTSTVPIAHNHRRAPRRAPASELDERQ